MKLLKISQIIKITIDGFMKEERVILLHKLITNTSSLIIGELLGDTLEIFSS